MLCVTNFTPSFISCFQDNEIKVMSFDPDRSKVQSLMSSSPGIKSKIRFRLGGNGGNSSSVGNAAATGVVDQTMTSSAAGGQTNASKSVRSTAAPSGGSSGRTSSSNVAPFHSRNLTFNFSRVSRRGQFGSGSRPLQRHQRDQLVITQSSVLTFVDFVDLFRAFAMHMRRDLRELFEQHATISHLPSIDQPAGISDALSGTQCLTFPSCRVNGT
jgi:hypothetical protein